MHNKLTVLLFSVMAAACASGPQVDPAFVAALRTTGKATIASYRAWNRNLISAGITQKQREERVPQMQELAGRCIAAMEKVLVTGKGMLYVERSTLGLSGPGPLTGPLSQDGEFDNSKLPEYYQGLKAKDGVTAVVRVTLIFATHSGWMKPVKLGVRWEVLTPEGHIEIDQATAVTSDKAEEMFPDALNPRYADRFVELAKANAEKFVEYMSP